MGYHSASSLATVCKPRFLSTDLQIDSSRQSSIFGRQHLGRRPLYKIPNGPNKAPISDCIRKSNVSSRSMGPNNDPDQSSQPNERAETTRIGRYPADESGPASEGDPIGDMETMPSL